MSDKSGIEWTEATWNPVTGCSKVSQGCKHCYAEREWPRLAAPRAKPNIYTGRAFTDVRCHPAKLDIPLRWTKPRRIFVNSMSDLFHESVPISFIDDVFARISFAQQHVFQILTKRPERMRDYFASRHFFNSASGEWPWKHVWLGVSIEDQETADERIPLLLQTAAAVRFVSCEPLLGPVDLVEAMGMREPGARYNGWAELHWIIVGGESGPKARPMAIEWAEVLRYQCQTAGVPFFMKQLSGNGGRTIKDMELFPESLRVREYPK